MKYACLLSRLLLCILTPDTPLLAGTVIGFWFMIDGTCDKAMHYRNGSATKARLSSLKAPPPTARCAADAR